MIPSLRARAAPAGAACDGAEVSEDPPLPLSSSQVIGAIILPFIAFAIDSLVVRLALQVPWALWGYTIVGAIALVLSARYHGDDALGQMVRGAILVCALGATLIGAVLLPFGIYELPYYGLGLLCLIPLAAAAAYWSRFLALTPHWRRLRLGYCLIGALIAIVPPTMAQGVETAWIRREMARLSGGDVFKARAALRRLNDYPLAMGRFRTNVCDLLGTSSAPAYAVDAKFTEQMERMIGSDRKDCVPGNVHR
jgi:hypothetical protein